MPNKHFCQGPECHTRPTSDRFLKSKGIIRGRYAYAKIDEDRYYHESDKYFCSQSCKNEWLNVNMECVRSRTVVPFIEHRRISEGYEKVTENHYGRNYNTIKKIGVDNDNENDRIIP